ncbi:MAG: carboxypeptidase-like regulatory domain-containing protein [Bacteroidota bacterium]
MRKTLPLMFFMLCIGSMVAFGQQRTLSGVIKDEQGLPIPGVSISVKGGKTIGLSDANGAFTVSVSADDETLVFTSVGIRSGRIKTR